MPQPFTYQPIPPTAPTQASPTPSPSSSTPTAPRRRPQSIKAIFRKALRAGQTARGGRPAGIPNYRNERPPRTFASGRGASRAIAACARDRRGHDLQISRAQVGPCRSRAPDTLRRATLPPRLGAFVIAPAALLTRKRRSHRLDVDLEDLVKGGNLRASSRCLLGAGPR